MNLHRLQRTEFGSGPRGGE